MSGYLFLRRPFLSDSPVLRATAVASSEATVTFHAVVPIRTLSTETVGNQSSQQTNIVFAILPNKAIHL